MGQQINSRLNQRILNLVFTIFLVLTGSFVLIREGSRFFQDSGSVKEAVGNTEAHREDFFIHGNPCGSMACKETSHGLSQMITD